MNVAGIKIEEALNETQKQLEQDESISPGLRGAINLLMTIVTLLCNQLGINSANSSKPPSQDQNRNKSTVSNGKKESGKRKPGAQKGHVGKTLERISNPDIVEPLEIDRRTLPAGEYKEVEPERRQVFDIEVSLVVTEYQAQVLEDSAGNQYTATFPEGVSKAAQYGNGIKAESVYLSQHQLVPYQRVSDHFNDQFSIPISTGSIVNFNQEVYERLEQFERKSKEHLAASALNHADETGINVNGKRLWLHNLSNDKWTFLYPHEKRGKEAMDEMGVLSEYTGILCHDHWKPYYRYKNCEHALCNAHHLRELQRAWEQDSQLWAQQLKTLLLEANDATKLAGGALANQQIQGFELRYREILEEGKKECPAGAKSPGKRGRVKNSKSRNLFNRLIEYESDVLRFIKNVVVPFTNNQGENDIRMTKVHQKISGCFRSMHGAKTFCRIRSYLITARKHSMNPALALQMLFQGETPEFMR